jgi:hypothetical protein
MPHVERRTFLALGVAALGLAGCTGDRPSDAEGESQPPRPPAQDPDAALRERVAASEAALIAAYRAALAAHPDLAPELEPFVAHHEAHLARVAADLANPSAPPGASPTASDGDRDPGSVAATLERLAEAEAAALRDRVAACDAATNSVLARDLCLIAASEAQHQADLAALLDERGPG